MYVAAVDSACNRSCAGRVWIREYLAVVARAPEAISGLVAECPCSDQFRFGNGGTLRSTRRIRLPAVIGGQVVLFWFCEIPCDTLGCLIGKDVLESLGGMIDFVGQKLMFQFLSQTWISLQRMKVGHFSLALLPPSGGGWARPTGLRWRVIGVGGCCEVQSGKGKMAWRAHMMLRCGSSAIAETVCEIAQSHAGGRSRAGGIGVGAMESDTHSPGAPAHVGLQGSDAMVGAEALLAVHALPGAGSELGAGLARADPQQRAAPGVAEALVTARIGGYERGESAGREDPQEPDGTTGVLHGGRDDDVGHSHVEEAAEGSPAGSAHRGHASGGRRTAWGTRRARASDDRTSRRPSQAQVGPDSAGGPSPRGGDGRGHRGDPEDQDPADRGRVQEYGHDFGGAEGQGSAAGFADRSRQGLPSRAERPRDGEGLRPDGSDGAGLTSAGGGVVWELMPDVYTQEMSGMPGDR